MSILAEIKNPARTNCPRVAVGKSGVKKSLAASLAWLEEHDYIELPRTKLTQVLVNTALDGQCMEKVMHYHAGGMNTCAHYRYEVVAPRAAYEAALAAVPARTKPLLSTLRSTQSKAQRGFSKKYFAEFSFTPERGWEKTGWISESRHAPSALNFTRIQAQIMRRICPPAWRVDWDSRGGNHLDQVPYFVEVASGETYHISNYVVGRENIRDAIAWTRVVSDAYIAFQKRRIAKHLRERNAVLDQYLSTTPVLVTVSDSTSAGNCLSMSERYRSLWCEKFSGLRIQAVRSDLILTDRDDDYTRRACRAAAIRAGALGGL